MIGEKHVVEVNLPSLVLVKEIPIAVVGGIEQETAHIECQVVQVEPLDAEWEGCVLFGAVVGEDLAVEGEGPGEGVYPANQLHLCCLPVLR